MLFLTSLPDVYTPIPRNALTTVLLITWTTAPSRNKVLALDPDGDILTNRLLLMTMGRVLAPMPCMSTAIPERFMNLLLAITGEPLTIEIPFSSTTAWSATVNPVSPPESTLSKSMPGGTRAPEVHLRKVESAPSDETTKTDF